ncbi:unnamed protein product [Cylindrotheca closterium]|uniref:Uncharacterized protein n=1 Tax=Cylindrotheca closterium TaxID=2856 RepID=A0AAD2CX08_9STRA|nr:unnamed protein product [Cylindrotheca closterium]
MSRPAKYRQIQTRSAEIDGDDEEQDFNSDHDATLPDGGPNKSPRGPTPDTEPEDTAPEDTETEVEESAEEKEREVPLNAWVHLTHEHCRAVCKGPISNSKKDRISCGKLKTKCHLHRVLREEGHRAKPMWYEGIVSTKDKNTNTGEYIVHGRQDGFSRSEERMDESLNRATGLDDKESPSEDEEGPEDTDREETDFDATDFEASEGETEGHLNEDPEADALQELNHKIALMERETQLLRLKAERAKLEDELPKKKPARKGKQATPSEKKAQATARKQTPIARKKKLRMNKPPPKQVSKRATTLPNPLLSQLPPPRENWTQNCQPPPLPYHLDALAIQNVLSSRLLLSPPKAVDKRWVTALSSSQHWSHSWSQPNASALLTTPTSLRLAIQSFTRVKPYVQDAATLWAGGIRATGGVMNPEKFFWWLINFEWDSRTGKWKFCGKKAVTPNFELQIQGLSGATESLRPLEPDDLERTLRVMLAPLENLKAHKVQMVAKGKDWAEQL